MGKKKDHNTKRAAVKKSNENKREMNHRLERGFVRSIQKPLTAKTARNTPEPESGA